MRILITGANGFVGKNLLAHRWDQAGDHPPVHGAAVVLDY